MSNALLVRFARPSVLVLLFSVFLVFAVMSPVPGKVAAAAKQEECDFTQEGGERQSDTPGNFGLEVAVECIKKNRPSSFRNVSNDPARLIGRIIGAALGLVGTLFLLMTIYAGFMWMAARGDTKMIDKAKSTLASAVIGLLIVVSAYALVEYVINSLQEDIPQEPTPAPASSTTTPSN